MKPRKIAEIAIFHGACQKLSEFSFLVSLLKRRKLRTVVEIGTMRGGSLWTWCQIAEPDALIASIDLPGGDFGGGYSVRQMRHFRSYAREQQRVLFLRKDSHLKSTKNELIDKLAGREIDFLMIDGDHKYSGVKRDFVMYSPLVKKNGIIAFHDILFHPKVRNCRVDRFWNEVKQDFQHKEFVEEDDDRGWGRWGGIGVLYF